jgi:BioD-like phosphotransacetylase family protein
MASVAASTDSDRSAVQLLSNEFDNMKALSVKLLAERESAHHVSPEDLRNDPLNQSILTCARSLASMVVGGQFVDDGSCH